MIGISLGILALVMSATAVSWQLSRIADAIEAANETMIEGKYKS